MGKKIDRCSNTGFLLKQFRSLEFSLQFYDSGASTTFFSSTKINFKTKLPKIWHKFSFLMFFVLKKKYPIKPKNADCDRNNLSNFALYFESRTRAPHIGFSDKFLNNKQEFPTVNKNISRKSKPLNTYLPHNCRAVLLNPLFDFRKNLIEIDQSLVTLTQLYRTSTI